MTFRKPEPIPLLFIICATLLLGGLGLWQVERLQWKQALVTEIENAQKEPVLSSYSNRPYRMLRLRGSFISDTPIRLVGRPQWEQGNGYFMLYPFKFSDGKRILVNVGWAPGDWNGSLKGPHLVYGVLRPAHGKRPFSPENHPEKNVWFYEDIDAMSKALDVPLHDMVLEAVGEKVPGVYPVPSDGKISLRNDHLGYAITWFSLMIIGLVMFALYHRTSEKKS